MLLFVSCFPDSFTRNPSAHKTQYPVFPRTFELIAVQFLCPSPPSTELEPNLFAKNLHLDRKPDSFGSNNKFIYSAMNLT